MLLLALLHIAAANPDRPLARPGEAVTERVYAALPGPPYTPKWRNKRGRFRCEVWPDGVAARCVERAEGGGEVLWRFDAAGGLRSKVVRAERPTAVTLGRAPDAPIDVSGWQAHVLGGWRAWLPPGEVSTDDGVLRWRGDGVQASLSTTEAPGADPRDPMFRDALAASCACVLVDRTTEDLDGRHGVRYRFTLPDPDGPRVGEAWIARDGDALVTLVATAPDPGAPRSTEDALATGRAIAALLHAGGDP